MARSRKRKASLARILLTIIFTALFVALAIFGIKYLMDNVFNSNTDTKEEEETTVSEENDSNVDITKGEYTVYEDEAGDLGFNFIIAELDFTTNSDTLYYDLNNLVTSDDKVALGETDWYYNQLNKFEYDLSDVNLTKSYVKSDTNKASVTVLIPYTKVSGELKVYYDTKALKFDLSTSKSAMYLIKSNPTTGITITDEETNKDILVTNSYISDYMEHLSNGEYVVFPVATNQAYCTFELIVNDINSNVKITDAYFIADGSSKSIQACDDSYRSMEIDNIIGKTLKKGDDYALFFPVNVINGTNLNLDGVLRIKFSDSDKYYEYETSLD